VYVVSGCVWLSLSPIYSQKRLEGRRGITRWPPCNFSTVQLTFCCDSGASGSKAYMMEAAVRKYTSRQRTETHTPRLHTSYKKKRKMEDIDGGEGKRSVPKKKLWRNTTHQNDLGTWKWMILCFVRNNICVVVGKKNGSSLERDRGCFNIH
jgi:hypothetical protein